MKTKKRVEALVITYWGFRGQGMSASGAMAALEDYLSPESNRSTPRITLKAGRLK